MSEEHPIEDMVEHLYECPTYLRVRHRTCATTTVTQRIDLRDGEVSYWCDTCKLFIHPLYAKEVLEDLAEF